MIKTLPFVILLSACASTNPNPAAEINYKQDIAAVYVCGELNAPLLDDGKSDASTIALAVAGACASEYARLTESFGLTNLENDRQRRMFRDKRNTVAARIENFLPFVVAQRKSQ